MKAWVGLAKVKDAYDKMVYYPKVIQNLQKELHLPASNFTNLGMIESRSRR